MDNSLQLFPEDKNVDSVLREDFSTKHSYDENRKTLTRLNSKCDHNKCIIKRQCGAHKHVDN